MDIGRVLIAIGLAGLAGTALYHVQKTSCPSWTSDIPMENLIRSCSRMKGHFTIEPDLVTKRNRFVCDISLLDDTPPVITK